MTNLGRIDASLVTDRGQVRDHNEDFILFREPTDAEDEARNGWVYIMADGVGGAEAGEVASQYASERTLYHFLQNAGEPDWQARLQQTIKSANRDLRSLAASRGEATRMATTLVAAVITSDRQAIMANVGDSRGYHWRQGKLQQVTKDHSLVAKLLEEGVLSAEEAQNYGRKNVILYSLGSDHEPQIDLFPLELEAQDILLLCSDGLTRHVTDEEISAVLARSDAVTAVQKLVSLANERGGEDNISVASIRYRPEESRQRQEQGTFAQGPVTADAGSSNNMARGLLWLLTLLLSLLQSAGIFYIWLILNT